LEVRENANRLQVGDSQETYTVGVDSAIRPLKSLLVEILEYSRELNKALIELSIDLEHLSVSDFKVPIL
jgi:hypothetical protein